jgi:hypothetical protein
MQANNKMGRVARNLALQKSRFLLLFLLQLRLRKGKGWESGGQMNIHFLKLVHGLRNLERAKGLAYQLFSSPKHIARG